ncbi:MAG: metal-dependent transcriptional regulator [Chloroflexi bacterium]|jgi:DtxR family transcriptional regulator, Mn-dependent transcriptional regulator|nr:metal-dependent transcriptional regulator [Chloroflexota bacterium]
MVTESEEMYLITAVLLKERGLEEPLPVSQLAEALSIQPVSAHQMIHRLAEDGWVTFTPYKGVTLTPNGETLALSVLRHRRLWEVFLVDQLQILPDVAAELACKLEHTVPDDIAERLSRFLGQPTQSPLGNPIPAAQSSALPLPERFLTQLKTGEESQVARIQADEATHSFLTAEGIGPGTLVTVLAIGSNGAILAAFGERSMYLSERTARSILIFP